MNNIIKKNGSLRFAAVLCLVALWVAAPFALDNKVVVSADELTDTRIGASLTGAPINGVTPAGYAEYRLDDQNRRRLDVQATSLNLAAGTSLTVSVNNAVVGTMGVNAFGGAFLSLDSSNGQNVPVINAGMPVQVTNNGSAVVAGTFGSVTPTPSPSGSPMPSPTGSPTGTPSPSPSPTGTPTGTPSPDPSPTGTPSPNPSPTGSPNPSPTGTPTGTPSPTPTGSPSPSPTGSPNNGLFAGLTGPTLGGVLPGGYAEFEIHSSRLELEIRIRNVNLPTGTALSVVVDNVNVGNLFIAAGGEGELRLRTDRGQTVPAVVAGSTISIRNGGTAILSGVFMSFTGPSPSPTPTGTPGPTPSPSPSPAFGRSFEAHLVRAQSAANGEIKVTLNAAETQATIFGEFHNLSSNQTGARIESLVGDGAVIFNLSTAGGTNGSITSVTVNVSAAHVQQLRTGLWSGVISTTANPAGEVRGTLIPRSQSSDFDGDGSNDLAVFRPAEGVWYSQNSTGFSSQYLGSAGDKVVSADYDGDGRTDAAVFKNVGGQAVWQLRRSSDGGTSSEAFGLASDIPARGDFDGDGRGDLAVYRPSNGTWYVKNSNNSGYTIAQFGINGDIPVPADMDGDGRDDIVVYRPGSGDWFWLRSSDGQVGIFHWGLNGDIPVRGDFDGDGRADLTVFRPATGVWYTYRSSDGGFQGAYFGLNGDVPVAGNFDSDGKTDVAVFRPSDGYWYVLRSSDGAMHAQPFGVNGDIPANSR